MDFNIWQLILEAGFVVKLVMLILFLGSIWSWYIIFQYAWMLKRAQHHARKFEEDFWASSNVKQFYYQLTKKEQLPKGMGHIFVEGFNEYNKLSHHHNMSSTNLISGIQRALKVALLKESAYVNRHLASLASVGSVSPYIGLFGTVWGIMHSFMGLSQSTTAVTIAVVAPGIAEALVATAIGLFAAIPATLFYNHFSDKVDALLGTYETFADEFLGIIQGEAEK